MTTTNHTENNKEGTIKMTTDTIRVINHHNSVALFIDVDNVLILAQNSGLPFRLSLIIDKVREQGRIMTSKAYADWTANLLRPFHGDFMVNAVELVQLMTSPASKEHKNTADIQLTVDAMEMIFSPVRPDIVVIVGGDRDYVPLVQKLKRYGIFVIGIGVAAGVSRVLNEACDAFVFYDDLVPPAPDEIEDPASAADRVEVYSLIRRAVEEIHRGNRVATGASVHEMMKHMAAGFDLDRYNTTFKELAWGAHELGYVRLIEVPGSDFRLDTVSATYVPVVRTTESADGELERSSIPAMTVSYRTILQDQRIPLLPWHLRKQYVELIWVKLNESGDAGLSIHQMREILFDYAKMNNHHVSTEMIEKLLYSLNFANCFNLVKDATAGHTIAIPVDKHVRLYPVVNIDEAMDRIHEGYIKILAGRAGILNRAAVFNLLYGEEIEDDQERATRIEALEKMCERFTP